LLFPFSLLVLNDVFFSIFYFRSNLSIDREREKTREREKERERDKERERERERGEKG